MICYRDITFCSFYTKCVKGEGCPRALTEEVNQKAIEWGGDEAPVCQYSEPPSCFSSNEKK